ncbi:hypothetical protein J3Q64DRAFT_1739946 [Phycomyces blakesleeanus]|uniref:Uncharacterized protein n=2 Tax=Phycomyces blakesleeanus TaxID=4837 RepID=A0A162PY93_PHYB8|nr:hypothetical protein PHYBLDRAFT_143602 [Phycomyces blakesleeanus NRRL 1555(-)]OAD75346.1 hypothetical protein PHYBLDRAFT_143602 [Phycomyces blakesleeanus NRRL 1555(-)]|eukprot:XP_018293386.1 hypothetical protein PHYBLDRAFT_143602 [Phycomyces blakesleeanus NRRL 1555(-)]
MDNSLDFNFSYVGKPSFRAEPSYRISLEPPEISPDLYYTKIPNDLPGALRWKQLIIWCAEHTKQKGEKLTGKQKQVAECQKRIIDLLVHDNIGLGWYQRDIQGPKNAKKPPNTRNLINKERLKTLQQELESLKQEKEERKQCMFEVYHEHAIAQDTVMNPPPFELDDHLDLLDPDQQAFMHQCIDEEDLPSLPVKEDLLAEISILPYVLSTIDKVQKAEGEFGDLVMKEAAKKLAWPESIDPFLLLRALSHHTVHQEDS